MRRILSKWLLAVCSGILAACAIITVNIYFPEKDVKEAYKSLDEMLLHQNGTNASSDKKKPEQPHEEKPQSSISPEWLHFSFVAESCAQESNTADALAIELASMPEVLKAYDEMKKRLPELNALRDNGVVGENFQGLVSVRDRLKSAEAQPIVDAENRDRKTIITGMARAIIKLNKQKETKDAMNQVLPKAAASYAATKKEEAKPGWWLLVAPDRWMQK